MPGVCPAEAPGKPGKLTGMRVRLVAAGAVPPPVVWARYAELDRWPAWAPHIVRAEPAGARLAPGLAGRVVGPLGLHVDYVVDEVARPRWRWTVRRGPLVVRLAHGVQAAGSGSRTWLELAGPAPVVLAYAPLARWALHRLVTLPEG